MWFTPRYSCSVSEFLPKHRHTSVLDIVVPDGFVSRLLLGCAMFNNADSMSESTKTTELVDELICSLYCCIWRQVVASVV